MDFIDPKQFEKSFTLWMQEITQGYEYSVVAIDGKTMWGTSEKKTGKKVAHIVSAWCSENKLVLGQVNTNDKSNEITAIPEILDMLMIKGSIVTIDAMGYFTVLRDCPLGDLALAQRALLFYFCGLKKAF